MCWLWDYGRFCVCLCSAAVFGIFTLWCSQSSKRFHLAVWKLCVLNSNSPFPHVPYPQPLAPTITSVAVDLTTHSIYIFNFADTIRSSPRLLRLEYKVIKKQKELLKWKFKVAHICLLIVISCYFRPLKLDQKTKRWTNHPKPRRQKWRPVLWTCPLRISCYGR